MYNGGSQEAKTLTLNSAAGPCILHEIDVVGYKLVSKNVKQDTSSDTSVSSSGTIVQGTSLRSASAYTDFISMATGARALASNIQLSATLRTWGS